MVPVLRLLLLGSAFGALSWGCSSSDRSLDPDPSSSVSQPIVGGTVDPGDPSAVLLGGGGGWCSGTLIAPKVVLTAGHCISPSNNFVYFGPQYLGDAGGSSIAVARSYANPGFSASNFRNADIGIVILATSSNVPPSALNTMALDASDVGQNLHIVGFGGTANPTEPEFTKMQVTVPVTGITAKEITAGPSICGGDSGGPATMIVNGAQVVAGVTSWHSSQACGGEAGFARVDLYAQWIQQQIDEAEAVDGGTDAGASSDGGDAGDGGSGAMTTGSDGAAADGADGGAAATPSGQNGCTFAARPQTPGYAGALTTLVAIGCGVWRRRRSSSRPGR
jgi:hypothetical protein